MPIRSVPDTDLRYALVVFDENGKERREPDGTLLSEVLVNRLHDPERGVSDVFVISHGWKGDIPGAIAQYDRWIAAMAQRQSDLQLIRESTPGFSPLIVAPHWPSLCFGDEDIPVGGAGGLLAAGVGGVSLDQRVDAFAKRICDTPAARAAIQTILQQSEQAAEDTPSPALLSAYDVLFRESGLGSGGAAAAPGSDQDGFSASAIIEEARQNPPPGAAAAPGLLGMGDWLRDAFLMPLRQLSFWAMKDRARQFGETGGHELLTQLQRSAPAARFHLMGHSFGCIVVSAMVMGSPEGPRLPRPVESVFLAQGALSLWSYANSIPYEPGTAGYFNRILEEGLVRGPIVTTRSTKDTAVGYFYPLGAKLKKEFVLADVPFPKYGGIGSFGIQGVTSVEDLRMQPATSVYAFRNGGIYNLEASDIIKDGAGASGAHSDIAHPEVAHAFWAAVLTSAVPGVLKQKAAPGRGVPGIGVATGAPRGGLLSIEEAVETVGASPVSSPAGKKAEDRWFNAELEDHPSKLAVGTWYTLAIDVDVQQRAGAATASAPVPPLAFPEGVDEIELTIQVDSADFNIREHIRPLWLPRVGRSRGKARFDISPLHDGPSALRATIHREGNFVQQLEFKFVVGVAREQAVELTAMGRPARAAAVLRHRDAGLSLKPAAGGGYDCTAWEGVQSAAQLPIQQAYLASAIDEVRQELMKVVTYQNGAGNLIFQSSVDIPDADRDMALSVMARAGARLFQQLFFGPDAGADSKGIGDWLYKAANDPKKRLKLQILSKAAPVPWQMLYLGDLSAPLDWDHFLGMRHVIEQIPFQSDLASCETEIASVPDLTVSVNVNTVIDKQIPGALVSRQASFWTRTAAARRRVKVRSRFMAAELMQALSDGTTDDRILYFYCHAASAGLASPGGPDSSCLQLTDARVTLRDLSLDAPTRTQLAGKPLVFINACESAQLSPAFYEGFVPYFMAKGARGVIGTECQTPALFAEAWAERFFERFLDGEPIGEAFLNLRREFLEQHGNPLGLLYAVHCDGDTQITPALAATA